MSQIKMMSFFAWGVAVGCIALASTASAHESPVPHAHPHGAESMPILAIGVMIVVSVLFLRVGKRHLHRKSEAMQPR